MVRLQPENWVKLYYSSLTEYARSRVPGKVVKDLVQDTFYAGLKSSDTFRSESKELTWLIAILRHKIYDYYRRLGSQKSLVSERLTLQSDYDNKYANELFNKRLNDSTAESNYLTQELNSIICQGLLTLTIKERLVFKLRHNGYETSEICQKLSLKEAYCWVLMSRARKKMKNFLYQHWLD
ncbi:RNA polymerase sigma factor [Flagellimonas sp. CMM7]|uniref:RNA polymerase sigma factor n=1 Tax=Flagellimonas sp. CMM7 TaxID=2654676 RepID=UPI0013D58087|nr:sigma-70 family RNA polymerase sigma factor [Flagellimonas sp. CMM7]UII80312.1 sigma-70 family RNA polymerase sigma factor [Flagellimonas sp. CMM7]